MTTLDDRDVLERRLHAFSERLDNKLAELEQRSQHMTGQHMGHLVSFREEHEKLKRQWKQSGHPEAGSADDTIEANFNSLLKRFDRWVQYVDEEFEQTR